MPRCLGCNSHLGLLRLRVDANGIFREVIMFTTSHRLQLCLSLFIFCNALLVMRYTEWHLAVPSLMMNLSVIFLNNGLGGFLKR